MLPFLASLWTNPLARRCIIYGAALLAISFAFKIWLNRHDDRIYQQGKMAITNDLKEATEKQIAIERSKIEADKAQVAIDKAKIDAEVAKNALLMAQIGKDRALMLDLHNKNIAEIERMQEINRALLANVAPSEWDNTLRKLSNDPAIKPPIGR